MLYIIRHGKTDWNCQGRLQGHHDIPLNEEGRAMARDAATEYKDIHFDVCYCSPLIRARETAELLLEGRNIPIIVDERLREISFGVYEGFAHVLEHPDCPIYPFFKDMPNYIPPEGAESFEHLYDRVESFLQDKVYPLTDSGKDVLIVGHGALNSAIVGRVKHYPLGDFWRVGIPNCKLIQLI